MLLKADHNKPEYFFHLCEQTTELSGMGTIVVDLGRKINPHMVMLMRLALEHMPSL